LKILTEVLDTKVLLVGFPIAACAAQLRPYSGLLSPLEFVLSRNEVFEAVTSVLSLSRMALIFGGRGTLIFGYECSTATKNNSAILESDKTEVTASLGSI